jgi:tetratricopeptide (TPR) repeat protein
MLKSLRRTTVLKLVLLIWTGPALTGLTARAQDKPDAASPASQTGPRDSRARQQAYKRYFEAQRLKRELQRTRNGRLLDETIKAFKDAIALDPEAAEPHVDLGELYFFFQSRRDLAEREAAEAIKLDSKSVSAHQLLARLYLYASRINAEQRADNVDRAVRAYEKVAELDPKSAEAWAVLAELYGGKNETAKQLQALEKWAACPLPNDSLFYNTVMNGDLSPDQALFRLSTLYLAQNRNQEAVKAARRAYEANPESNDYVRNLIGILRVAGTSADELRAYTQLMKSVGGPALMIGYGSALVRAGRYTEAIETLKEFAQFDPSNASAIGLLAIAQRRGGQRDAAIETLKAGISKAEAGVRTELTLELAQTFEEVSRNEEAAASYEQILDSILNRTQQTPASGALLGEVVNRLVRVYRRSGNQTKLQTLLTRTRRAVDEHNPLPDILTIETMREDGRLREAHEMALGALRRFPDDRSLKFTDAILLSQMKRYKESAELLGAMLQGDADHATDDASVYLLLSSVQLQSGALAEAEKSARKALELNPGDIESTVQLASVLDRNAKHADSEKILRELITREPDNASALNNLGYFLTERGIKLEEALGLIQQAVAIEPINGSFLDSLAWTYHKLGQNDKARLHLEKAMTFSRRNPTIHEHLGDVLKDLGQLPEARRQWEKALEYSIEATEIARLKVKLNSGQ